MVERLKTKRRTKLSLQELSDRALIQDHLLAECYALDERDWDTWETLFTPDAHLDWTEAGAIKGTPREIRAWAEPIFKTFPYPQYQHLTGNYQIEVDGDRAACRHMQYIAISLPSPSGEGRQIGFSGIWFEDKLVRTADGWLINDRYERQAWRHNFPPAYKPPEIK
jgi:hypothetical protein